MSEIKTWLDNALLQSAAESYLHKINLDAPVVETVLIQTQLKAASSGDTQVLGTQYLIMMEHRYGAASTSYFT